MSYRLSSKKRQQRKNFWLKTLVAIFVFSIALGLFTLLGGTITSLGSGVVSVTNNAKDAVFSTTVSKQDLIQENTKLQQEINQMKADEFGIAALRERNEELLRLLGNGTGLSKVVAGVIKKPPFSPYDIYTIDAGLKEGVSVGDLALFSDFITLGTVARSNNTGSKILLFSAPKNSTIMNLRDVSFESIGQGGGTMRVDVPRDFEVAVGDAVTLPGYNVYVAGLVQKIEFKPQDSFKKVFVKVPVNIESVEVVVTVPYNVVTQDEITEISNTQ